MPKRRHDSDEYILKKIKRLERKMEKWKDSSKSSETPTATEPTPPVRSPEPVPEPLEESIIIEEGITTNTTAVPEVLDASILEVLGSNYEKPQEMGKKIHSQIAARWENIFQNGLDKTEKENILKQDCFLPPENCPHLVVPKLNPETLAACSEQNKKRDLSISERQKMISAGISGLACATDKVITAVEPPEVKLSLLGLLNNTAKILSDVYFNENKTRRSLIVSGLEKEIKDTLLETKPEKYLFGDDLHEKIKTAKSVGKTGREMRLQPKPVPKANPAKGPQALNWKGPPRQTQRPLPESRVTKIRSNGPRQAPAKRGPPTAARGYRKQTSSHHHHQHRN